MARTTMRYSVYPTAKALGIVGTSSPGLNQAIECWAALLARATADNAKTIAWYEGGISVGQVTGKWEDMHELRQWCVLAEVLKDMRFDPEFANPGELLATAVEDAHRLENVAEKWFSSFFDMEEYAKGLDWTVKDLVKKLRALDYIHAWAVIVAVQWYWDRHGGIDIKKDPWWTLAFRRKWQEARQTGAVDGGKPKGKGTGGRRKSS